MIRTATDLARRVILFELRLWRSLYRWTFRRPLPLGPGGEAFSYAGAQTPIIWAFIVVSAIEIPAVHLLLPWETARFVLLLLGIQTLFWMLGYLASLRVHPHVVGDAGLRIRYGSGVDIPMPWEAIAEIRSKRRSLPSGRTIQVGPDSVVNVAVMSQTNVDVVLRHPTTVRATADVSELRFYADDPAALVRRAQAVLTRWSPAG